MSFQVICTNCGAPSGPSVGVCPFCKAVLAKSSKHQPAELALIEKTLAEGKLQEALTYATEGANSPALAGDPAFLTLYGRILLEAEGPSSKIKSVLARACLLEPENIEAKEYLVIIGAKQKFTRDKGDEGERELRQLLKQSPENALALFILGSHLYWVQGESEDSRRMLERAVQLRPNQLRYWGCLGEIYKKTGNREAATRAYGKCIALETDPAMKKFFEERMKA